MALILVVVLVGPVAVLTFARRAGSHPAVRLLADICASVALLVRSVYRAARFLVRFLAGEVRSWTLSRS
jgi:hypothetical protein